MVIKDFYSERPQKKIFNKRKIDNLRNKAIKKIKLKLLPNEKIIKLVLIGSSVKNSFGEYSAPGFRGSLFSDFDFIVFVEDNFEIPKWLKKVKEGKLFPDDNLNLAYRNKKVLNNKYDFELFFIRKTNSQNPIIKKIGEKCGIPMTSNSKHKNLMIYSKSK
jgi:hypothetical protein